MAALIGDTREIEIQASESGRSAHNYTVQLNDWRVDLDRESPVTALGFIPWRPDVEPVLGQLLEDGRAAQAGLQTGDRILRVDGELADTWQGLVELIQASADQPRVFEVERSGRVLTVEVTPASRRAEDGSVSGFIGAGVQVPEWPEAMQREIRYGPVTALVMGVERTGQMIVLTLDSIRKMFTGIISVKNLSGPITIAKVAGDSAASGLEAFISFLAYLSISLGILNLLPIPMLDGGHLMYYMVELIRGKPVSEQVQSLGLKIGMLLLFSLMAVAMFNDIARL